ncbi:hypothetical protein BDW59DRAFT_162299 [Aspergillus cavernicola]|uniref:NmrA-like domain-containing protein n=1 Tax=Aspergillus cavernicola TaxID=176166 RepID=A0ABR4IA92_9EURO
MPQTVVVIGATGSQGGAVVEELLEHPDAYHVRALTRDPIMPAAQLLAAMGVEAQRTNLDEGREALATASAGAHAIYALTDFWQKQSGTDETTQGKAIVDAALFGGRFLNVYHWKSKSLVTEYIEREQPDLWAETTAILFPNYFENCLTSPEKYLPTKNASGMYTDLCKPNS